jgi:RNA polymerase sigma-70 factor, ECF subfamily
VLKESAEARPGHFRQKHLNRAPTVRAGDGGVDRMARACACARRQERLISQPDQDRAAAELVRAVARGDEQAFAALYDQYGRILFGLLARILRSRPEAEDALQEVFLQVWQQAASFDEARGRAFTWLVTLARSRAIDRLRAADARDRAARRSSDESAWAAAETTTEAADDAALRSERGEIVRRALAELPEEQRRNLLLAYLDGMSQSEIAERTGQPLGTVKTRMRAGLKKLGELLRNRKGEV